MRADRSLGTLFFLALVIAGCAAQGNGADAGEDTTTATTVSSEGPPDTVTSTTWLDDSTSTVPIFSTSSTTTTTTTTTPRAGNSCPVNSTLNIQGLCLCDFDDTCVGADCNIGSTVIGIRRYVIHYFRPSCANCQCLQAPCPAGTVRNGETGECLCVRSQSPSTDYNSVCTGPVCYRSRVNSTLIDWFHPTCTTCSCVTCPVGTGKDTDGDCQCPPDAFCIGSLQCRESTVQTLSFGPFQYRIGSHIHYFKPPCADCRCVSQALDDFIKIPTAQLREDGYNCKSNIVASKCAGECLDDPSCLSIKAGTGNRNGDCCKSKYNRQSAALAGIGFEVSSSITYTYYERRDAPNVCDANNGGCGDEKFIECDDVDGKAVCTDINECLVNNGGCADSQTCTNVVGAAPVCLTPRVDPCVRNPCARGTCVSNALLGESYECVLTCSDSPCAEGVSVCADRPKSSLGFVTGFNCTCAPGYGGVPGSDGSGCAVEKCVLNNGGCGDPKSAVCDKASGACSCVVGWRGPLCATAICSTTCVRGSCAAPGEPCTCDSGWSGPYCDVAVTTTTPPTTTTTSTGTGTTDEPDTNSTTTTSTPGVSCLIACLHGSCNSQGTACVCDDGWSGTVCERSNSTCTSCNSARGDCVDGRCVCRDPTKWTGASCDVAICSSSCGRGFCQDAPGTCTCFAGWGPADLCTQRVCEPSCVHGSCVVSTDGSNAMVCKCDGNWTGGACSVCQEGYSVDANDSSRCVAVCGDGLRVQGVEECDDGNLRSGDGCSSSCTLEPGWRCSTPVLLPTFCADPDECSPNPCAENSTCRSTAASSGTSSFTCLCKDGFEGEAGPNGSGCVAKCPGNDGRIWTICGGTCTPSCTTTCANGTAPFGSSCAAGQCVCPLDKPLWDGTKCITRVQCPAAANTSDCSIARNGPNGKGCENSGLCFDAVANDGRFTCDCSAVEYSGSNCQIFFPASFTPILRPPRYISFVFKFFGDYFGIFGRPESASRIVAVKEMILAALRAAGVSQAILDRLDRIEFARGSVLVWVLGEQDVITAIRSAVESDKVTVSIDGVKYPVCSELSDQAACNARTNEANGSGSDSSTARGSSSVSSTAIAGIVAGAVVLLALIVAYVVVSRRKRSATVDIVDSRNITSFTSPLYADGNNVAFSNPTYADPPPQDGSLYSRPAVRPGAMGQYDDITPSGPPAMYGHPSAEHDHGYLDVSTNN